MNGLIPFRGVPFLLHLRKYTFCFVVDAVRALGHLPIAFDLLLPAHITGLQLAPSIRVRTCRRVYPRGHYPCYPPPLHIAALFCVPRSVVIRKDGSGKGWWDGRAVCVVSSENLGRRVHHHGHLRTCTIRILTQAVHGRTRDSRVVARMRYDRDRMGRRGTGSRKWDDFSGTLTRQPGTSRRPWISRRRKQN
jgi:hypothetical protein